MVTVGDIYDELNEIAPFSIQESYDNSGLVIGNRKYGVEKALIALDVTTDVANEAVDNGCDLIITHHPVIFKAIKQLDLNSVVGILAADGVSVISAHTNFDSAKGGMNDLLCETLGFEPMIPLAVENGVPIGYICEMPTALTAKQLAGYIKNKLNCGVIRYNNMDAQIRKVAVCGGSGGSFLPCAISHGADAFITGDVKHDVFIDAYNNSISLFDAGHFNTENIFCEHIKNVLSEKFSDVEFVVAESNRDILSYEY